MAKLNIWHDRTIDKLRFLGSRRTTKLMRFPLLQTPPLWTIVVVRVSTVLVWFDRRHSMRWYLKYEAYVLNCATMHLQLLNLISSFTPTMGIAGHLNSCVTVNAFDVSQKEYFNTAWVFRFSFADIKDWFCETWQETAPFLLFYYMLFWVIFLVKECNAVPLHTHGCTYNTKDWIQYRLCKFTVGDYLRNCIHNCSQNIQKHNCTAP